MRILSGENVLTEVLVYLTRDEAAELGSAAADVLLHCDDADFHVHVSSADYQVEMTFAPEVPSV